MKTKLSFVVFLITISCQSAICQVITKWANNYGSNSHEGGDVICTDSIGNSYFGGFYWDSLQLCSSNLPAVNQQTNGIIVNYIFSKLDSNGICVWTKVAKSYWMFGGSNVGKITDAKFYKGHIYFTGSFTGPIIFDNDTLYDPNCGFGCFSMFILKIDLNGNIVWKKYYPRAEGISIMPTKNGLFFAGSYSDSVKFGNIQLYPPIPSQFSGFLLKTDFAGSSLWVINTGTASIGSGVADAVFDNNKSIYLAGIFFGGNIAFPGNTLNNISSVGYFITKYDTSGNFIWLKGGDNFMRGSLSNEKLSYYSGSGSLYITGDYSDTLKIGATTYTSPPNQSKEVLMKLNTSGQILWTKNFGRKNLFSGFASSIESNSLGALLFTLFTSTTTIGTSTLNSNSGSEDLLLVQFDNNGNIVWHKEFGGNNQELPGDINYNNGNVYLTGANGSSYNLDGINMNHVGASDILVARFKDISLPPLNLTGLLQEDGDSNSIMVYPNPSSDAIFIHNKNNIVISEIEILDLQGRVIFNSENTQTEIFLGEFDPGIYFVKIVTSAEIIVKKIVLMD